MNGVVDNLIEVTLDKDEDFLKIKETLQRIGVASKKERKLYQSCSILFKQGRYYIVHFKEMFLLDGRESDFSEEDKGRRNKIIELLLDWNLLKVVDPSKIKEPLASMSQIKVLSFREKSEWELVSKYTVGKKRF